MGLPGSDPYTDSFYPTQLAETYLLTMAEELHGPFAGFTAAAAEVFGDVSGDPELAFGSFRSIALACARRDPDIWLVSGALRRVTQRRIDRIIEFFTGKGLSLDAQIVLAPHGEFKRHPTVFARLPAVFEFLKRRGDQMRIEERPFESITNRALLEALIGGWVTDNHQWADSLDGIVHQFGIKESVVSVNVQTMTFDWSGPALTLLDENPARLVNAPIANLLDKPFVEGITLDLKRATAVLRPYLCRISTPLNGVLVEYDLLSLPLKSADSDSVTSCLRIPLELTLKSAPPAHFDPQIGSLPTKLILPQS